MLAELGTRENSISERVGQRAKESPKKAKMKSRYLGRETKNPRIGPDARMEANRQGEPGGKQQMPNLSSADVVGTQVRKSVSARQLDSADL